MNQNKNVYYRRAGDSAGGLPSVPPPTACSAPEPVCLIIELNIVTAVIEAAEENTQECRRDYAERYDGYLHLAKNRRVIELYDEQLAAIAKAKALLPNPESTGRTRNAP